MTVIPKRELEQIEFCEARVTAWTGAPTTIGLTAGQVLALSAATTAARTAYTSTLTTRNSAKAATTLFQGQRTTMLGQIRDLVRIVKGFAEASANPAAVYAAAQIPPPVPPEPLPAPGKPTDFLVLLNPDGSVTLSWDSTGASASSGAYFAISRRLPGQPGFTPLGGAPGSTSELRRASYTDGTIPAAAAAEGVRYIVQGFRGTRAGEASDAVIVQFGLGEGGGFASVRLAA
jgi:hypothetical protein